MELTRNELFLIETTLPRSVPKLGVGLEEQQLLTPSIMCQNQEYFLTQICVVATAQLKGFTSQSNSTRLNPK